MNPHTHATSAVGSAPRRGMTLVELLVVAAVVAMLLGLVVTGVRGGRQVQKRGAETLAAVLAAAQARALGVPEGAAAILASGTGEESNAAAACTQVYDAVMQPLIEAGVTGTPPTLTVTPTNGDDVQRAYKIVLSATFPPPVESGTGGVGPATAWLAFTPPSTVAFRGALGQTAYNTVWPKPPVSGTFSGLLAQYPAKSSTVAELGEGSAIDLRFSGIGDNPSTTYGRLDGKGALAVVFDRVGRVAEVIQQVPEPGATAAPGAAQPAIPVGTIYFLVVPREQIVVSAASNTLASQDAAWVALAPQTGRVFVADNVPQADTSDASLRAARAKARQGIGVGR